MNRRYRELFRLETFEERYHYLALHGQVGESTFGYDRWMNQMFYKSREWTLLRDHIIVRDNGCDLGILDRKVTSRIIIHHMNPMTAADLTRGDPDILNPEFLISCSHQTHNAIHYGDESLLPRLHVARVPGDTKLW